MCENVLFCNFANVPKDMTQKFELRICLFFMESRTRPTTLGINNKNDREQTFSAMKIHQKLIKLIMLRSEIIIMLIALELSVQLS